MNYKYLVAEHNYFSANSSTDEKVNNKIKYTLTHTIQA
jgi:hypothetical protein